MPTSLPCKYTVLTTMNRAILNKTGRRMISSLARWPKEVQIAVAFEGSKAGFEEFRDEFGGHATCIDLCREDLALFEWMKKYKRHPGQDALKKCAWRFAYKSFVVTGVGLDLNADVLIWLDADTYTHRELPISRLEKWLPAGKMVAFLGREGNISECGFVMYDLREQKVKAMLEEWRRIYWSGKLFDLDGWNDCYVFDWVRLKHLAESDWHNLTPWGTGFQHVFINSAVGAYMDHSKGARKGGKSKESDVIQEHVSRYFMDYLRST